MQMGMRTHDSGQARHYRVCITTGEEKMMHTRRRFKLLMADAGKSPYTQREIELSRGEHTVVVVMGNSLHQALAVPAPASVTFTVK